MGCACGGPNHLMVGVWGKKGNHPLCGETSGYMWDQETFQRRVEEGNACTACLRTIERDKAISMIQRLYLQIQSMRNTFAMAAAHFRILEETKELLKEIGGDPDGVL